MLASLVVGVLIGVQRRGENSGTAEVATPSNSAVFGGHVLSPGEALRPRFLASVETAAGASQAALGRSAGRAAVAGPEPAPKVCAVLGVGPGIGEHVARTFAAEASCRVALIARTVEKVANMSQTIPGSKGYACDALNASQVKDTFAAIRRDLGEVDALIYNIGLGSMGVPYDAVDPERLMLNMQGGALGLLLAAQEVAPGMAKRGHGAIGVTGATGSWRGKAKTAAFAPGKFASRALAQSLARELGPQGVHVFHVVVDGIVLMTPDERQKHPEIPEEHWMLAEDIAETYYNLAVQPRSAWSFETSLAAWGDFAEMYSI